MWFRAALFTLLINAPALYEYIFSGGLSLKIFSDWDEVFYFPVAQTEAQLLLSRIGEGNWDITWLFSPIPHHSVEVLIGLLTRFLSVKLATTALVLDLLIAFVSYAILSRAYSFLTETSWTAELGAFVTLFFPWIFSLSTYFTIPIPFSPQIVTVSHFLYPCQPVLRGVSTQLSYPIFALSLFYLFSFVRTEHRNLRTPWLSGAFAGLTNYLYFFAWPSLVVFSVFFLIFLWLVSGDFKRLLSGLAAYCTGTLLTSSVALWGLYRVYAPHIAEGNNASGVDIRLDFWFFSIEQMVIGLAFLWLAFRRKKAVLPGLAIFASVLATLALMNTQAFTKTWTVPYHFPLFYLDPLLSGFATMAVFEFLKTQKIRRMVVLVLLAFAVGISTSKIIQQIRDRRITDEIAELAHTIEANTPRGADLLLMPWSDAFGAVKGDAYVFTFPYSISSLAHRNLFIDPVRHAPEYLFLRELVTAWIYSGELQFTAPCPVSPPALPGDMLRGVLTRDNLLRYNFCQQYRERIAQTDLCLTLQSATPAYVIWQYPIIKEVPPQVREVLESVWKGTSGKLELFKFNRELAVAKACANKTQ